MAGLMETFHMSMNEILWEYDWINITLLMTDKLRYVGKEEGKNRVKKIDNMSPDDEDNFFRSLI